MMSNTNKENDFLKAVIEDIANVIGVDNVVNMFPENIGGQNQRYNNKNNDRNNNKNNNKNNTDDLRVTLKRAGFDDERINDIIKEQEEKKKAEEEKKEKEKADIEMLKNNVVEMTLKSIASSFGYIIEGAVIKDDKPMVSKIKPNTDTDITGVIFVEFDSYRGRFIVCINNPTNNSNKLEIGPSNFDKFLKEFSNAANLCNALNSIDVRTWPVI